MTTTAAPVQQLKNGTSMTASIRAAWPEDREAPGRPQGVFVDRDGPAQQQVADGIAGSCRRGAACGHAAGSSRSQRRPWTDMVKPLPDGRAPRRRHDGAVHPALERRREQDEHQRYRRDVGHFSLNLQRRRLTSSTAVVSRHLRRHLPDEASAGATGQRWGVDTRWPKLSATGASLLSPPSASLRPHGSWIGDV